MMHLRHYTYKTRCNNTLSRNPVTGEMFTRMSVNEENEVSGILFFFPDMRKAWYTFKIIILA